MAAVGWDLGGRMMNTFCANKMGREEDVVVLATFTAG